ncbi:hypothetical protein CVCC1112_195 [Paenarthrobacter nicotinovorans]|nr:hypothetical protein CVCC1112_195 [Paenarthrobacter nicotinovorans]
MKDSLNIAWSRSGLSGDKSRRNHRTARRRFLLAGVWAVSLLLAIVGASAWLGSRASTAKSELQAATLLLPTLKSQLGSNDASAAADTVDELVEHTGKARDAVNDPLWKVAAVLPWLGANFQAVSEVAISADDVARLGAAPLVKAFQSLDWKTLTPRAEGMNLAPLSAAAPQVQSAAHTVRESAQRLNDIPAENLLPQVSDPLIDARNKLSQLQADLDSAADAATLAPTMLGADGPKRYLLLIQNSAESRATGGIPGALAVLTVDKGGLSLGSQKSAGDLGAFVPPIPTDPEQQAIYSGRVGKFMQDVNLTPDFATTATTARTMWERSAGEHLDGVLSVDPVALSFILDATGPVNMADPVIQRVGRDLPRQLTGQNVVPTLLSDVYAKIDDPRLQDVYFAGAAKEIFSALSSGSTDPKRLFEAISKGVSERRILLWSATPEEQKTIARYPLGGAISGPAIYPTQFGVYFNDGTGAKMDYWIKRQVRVVKDCTSDGYREVTLRVTSTNTAPTDAATSLPAYVTGDGAFGVPAGSVQTNIVAYGPVQSNIDTVVKDEQQIPFAAQRHSQRAVATSTIRLAPGETTSLEFNFGHIVQHSEAKLVATPTTQAVDDVLQPPSLAACE